MTEHSAEHSALCDHRWVRLVDSEPLFPEDVCVKCHMQRGTRIHALPPR